MATVNIGNSDDPFYRYRRPASICTVHSGTTFITNLEDIANSLHTKPAYILHFIKLKKSTPVTPKGGIKMVLTKSQVEELINQFIEQYVLCTLCAYPELVITRSRKKLYFACQACGNPSEIPLNKFTKIIYREYY